MSVHGLREGLREPGDEGRGAPFAGRERELARLRAELGQVRAGESRLVSIDGPAGMGKTALVRRFLAKADGLHMLCASGDDGEALLPYGIVAQLAPELSVLGEGTEEGRCLTDLDPLVVGSALLDLLQGLQDHAVAVVIDNAHWADLPSLSALIFALRRLGTARVLSVVITIDAADPRLPGGLRRMLADDETTRLSLAGLGVAELRALSGQLGRMPLARRAAGRLREHTDGNPLHARALLERVPAEALDDSYAPLPAPRSYESLVLDRLADCPPEGRLLIEAASVLGRSCALDEAAALSEVEDPLPAAEQAVRTGLLTERPSAGGLDLRFAEPLVQAAVYQRLGPAQRTRLHLRASDVVADDSARLHHRLRAAGRPDEHLAVGFAGLARRYAASGLWAMAAEHMTWAARLSTSGDERVRRTAEAVEALLFDGQVAEASALAEELADDAELGARGYALGAIAIASGRPREAALWLIEAWQHCDQQAEPALAARIAEQLSFSQFLRGSSTDGAVWAERASALARHRPGTDLVRTAHLHGLAVSGKLREGLRLSAWLPAAAVATVSELDALLGRGLLLIHSDDIEQAVAELTAVVAASPLRSVQHRLVALAALGWAEFHFGNWDDAAAHAEAAVSGALDTDQAWFEPIAHGLAALVPAARGEWQAAAAHVRTALKAAGPDGGFGALAAVIAKAHLAIAHGDRQKLLMALESLTGASQGPALPLWHEHLIEVLIAVDRIDQAEEALVAYEKLGAAYERHSVLASAARLRGNLHAAQDDGEAAESTYQIGLQHAARVSIPFVHARLELDYGRVLRRSGRRSLAAEHLAAARAIFEQLGARPYIQRCDNEPGPRSQRSMQIPALRAVRLTPQEHAVARLAASGMTNRQVAGELVLSVKTIEYHLGNAYSKLGVAGRSHLAAKLAEYSAQGTQGWCLGSQLSEDARKS